MSLFRAERRRLLKRRFVRYLCLAGLLILLLIMAGTFLTNHRVGPAQVAAAQQEAERNYQAEVRANEQFRAECERAEAAGTKDLNRFPMNCVDIVAPSRDEIQPEWYMPATFDFRQSSAAR
jgi:ABC-2 type transport system permease protein